MMDTEERNLFIAYYVLFLVAFVCNLAVTIMIIVLTTSKYTPFFVLLLFLHISNMIEELALLPFIYKQPPDLCIAVESIKFYCGLMNIFAVFFLIQAYRIIILSNFEAFTSRIRIIIFCIILIFPFFGLLPLITRSFEYPNLPWCSLPDGSAIYWAVWVQYLWVWLLLFAGIATNVYMMFRILIQNHDYQLFKKYGYTAGGYSLVAFVSWAPRSIDFFSTHDESVTQKFRQFFPVYIAGILYCIIFFATFHMIIQFENTSHLSLDRGLVWDTHDILAMFEQMPSSGNNSEKSISMMSLRGLRQQPNQQQIQQLAFSTQRSHQFNKRPSTSFPGSALESPVSSLTSSSQNSMKRKSATVATNALPLHPLPSLAVASAVPYQPVSRVSSGSTDSYQTPNEEESLFDRSTRPAVGIFDYLSNPFAGSRQSSSNPGTSTAPSRPTSQRPSSSNKWYSMKDRNDSFERRNENSEP
jgi:hypothetical protein